MRLRSLIVPAFASLALGLLVLPPATSTAADDDAPIGIRKPMPKSVKAIESQLGALQKRIDELVKVANRDPAELKIRIYKKYTAKQLKKTRGRVRAEDLVDFMVDAKKDFETVRKPAMDAILEGGRIRGDPDLSVSEKQGPRTKRAYFCIKKLLPYLKDDKVDRFARKLVADLLLEFYGQGKRITEIRAYNQDNENTWKSAYNAWQRFLKKQ